MQLELPLRWNKEAVIWAAGFYEGEGSVTERHTIVTQVNIWPLQKLKDIFGGSIRPKKVDIPRQPIFAWTLAGAKGRDFIRDIYPYLSPRRQAQIDETFITWEKYTIRRAIFDPIRAERTRTLVRFRKRDENGRYIARRA